MILLTKKEKKEKPERKKEKAKRKVGPPFPISTILSYSFYLFLSYLNGGKKMRSDCF
jgi:hypothetical protein